MMNAKRLKAEQCVLAQRLPAGWYRFENIGGGNPFVRFAARTNRGNVYTIHVELADFPLEVPAVYVTRMLHDRDGDPLDSCSASMHVLNSSNGWTRICHYGYDSWNDHVSLYKIFVKARLWLEMYEQHLRDGHDIDYWLTHQA